ncbi:MAG: KpsF/GutQ family sugar-phosphate isomerase [Desulfobacterales bacterium]|nr:KpsF/GutQ family sugar-phosphate isomerase [Desulfobacterales bacterium]MCP4160069.1 KpsF/GutQ family sugar-phosphate isomerase [Deltaproteobacteria bacterium]
MIKKQIIDVLKTEAAGILEIADKIDENFVKLVDTIYESKGRVIFSGIGKSGLIGKKIVATLNSTGTVSVFLHPVEAVHGDLGLVAKDDIFIALSNSGETSELNSLIPQIQTLGCTIVAFTGKMDSTLAKNSDIVIDVGVQKEACPLGLAPTTSTTALLAAGDALAVVLINKKQFKETDFKKVHPGGSLGQRLSSHVKDLMILSDKTPVIQINDNMTVMIETIDKFRLGAALVEDEKKLVGIVTDGDIRHLVANNKLADNPEISSFMTKNPKSVFHDTPVYDALYIMEQFQITVLPVTDNSSKIVGILHLHDILGKGAFQFNGS